MSPQNSSSSSSAGPIVPTSTLSRFSSTPGLAGVTPSGLSRFAIGPSSGTGTTASGLSRFSIGQSSETGTTASGLSRFSPGSIPRPTSLLSPRSDGLSQYQGQRIDERNAIYEEAIAGGALTVEDAKALFLSGEAITDPNIFSHIALPQEAFNASARLMPKENVPSGGFFVGDRGVYYRPERFSNNVPKPVVGERFFAPTEWIPEDALQSGLSRQQRQVKKHGPQWRFDPASWELAGGGMVMGPVVGYGLGGPVAAAVGGFQEPGAQLSQEQKQLLQGAIAALDPRSKMSEDDRMLILREFEEEFGPGSVKILMEEMQSESKSVGVSDGLSDSIPAVVDGVQPAALSEGEFVVPSDVVSDVGNGSTDAGSRELMGMVDRIRSARGQAGKPKKINAGNLLVA